VTIKVNECAIIKRGFDEGWVVAFAAVRSARARQLPWWAPARPGWPCAEELNAAGHLVTVYERADRIGGLLMYGIPAMKLDKGLVERRVKLMEEAGVRFQDRRGSGQNHVRVRVAASHDALVICGGACKPRDLPVEGRNLRGVHFAMEYLTANTRSLLDGIGTDKSPIQARTTRVVIGGGDKLATTVWHGSSPGLQERHPTGDLPRPPDQRALDNPWPLWPKIYRVDYGQEEAATRFGTDPRLFSVQTQAPAGRRSGEGHRDRRHSFSYPSRKGGRRRSRNSQARLAHCPLIWCCWPWVFSVPSARACWLSWAWISTAAATWQSTKTSRPASPASSPPATWRAASPWWSGPSWKAGRRRAAWTGS